MPNSNDVYDLLIFSIKKESSFSMLHNSILNSLQEAIDKIRQNSSLLRLRENNEYVK